MAKRNPKTTKVVSTESKSKPVQKKKAVAKRRVAKTKAPKRPKGKAVGYEGPPALRAKNPIIELWLSDIEALATEYATAGPTTRNAQYILKTMPALRDYLAENLVEGVLSAALLVGLHASTLPAMANFLWGKKIAETLATKRGDRSKNTAIYRDKIRKEFELLLTTNPRLRGKKTRAAEVLYGRLNPDGKPRQGYSKSNIRKHIADFFPPR
jgi:hypothetical protein